MASNNKNTYIRRDMCRKFEWVIKNCDAPIIIYDTETTGLTKNDYIVQLSGIKLTKKDGKYSVSETLNLYIKPPIAMPKEASEVNHITDEILADKPTEAECIDRIRDFFGDVSSMYDSPIIAGYNIINFDNKMMNAMYERTIGERFCPTRIVDALVMAKEVVNRDDLPDKSRNLTSVAQLYGIQENNMHSSDTDTLVTGRVMWAMINDYMDNYKVLQDPAKQTLLPKIDITGMYPFKKSKTVNYIMINVGACIDGEYIYGRFHYDLYERRYVEDEGDLMGRTDMLQFTYDADKYAGGDISKFKSNRR